MRGRKMSKEKTRKLHQQVKPYTFADHKKSTIQIFNTIVPLIITWIIAYIMVPINMYVAIGLSVIAAGLIVRTFIIFHDCTHGSFYHDKRKNNMLGTITGVLTSFPYEKWKREHAIHHASSSNLDERGIGDIWVMTIEEYEEATKWERLKYRLYRNPIIMFGFGPLYLVLVSNRRNRADAKQKEKNNTYLINVILLVGTVLIIVFVGFIPFLIVHGISVYIAAALGIWLFYIQHTFEDSYFEEESEWNYVKAAVEGSSYYELPKFLQWLTGNIGFHHVHHLAPRIPNYYLEEAHETTPDLQYATTITLKTSLDSLRYKLYDAEAQNFITFKTWKQRQHEKLNETKQNRVVKHSNKTRIN